MATRIICYDEHLDTILRHPRFRVYQTVWYTSWDRKLCKGTVTAVSMYKSKAGEFIAYTYKVRLSDGSIVDTSNCSISFKLHALLNDAKLACIHGLVDNINYHADQLDNLRKQLSDVMQLTEDDFNNQ